MSKLRFRISMSLDGFVTGPDQSVKNPIGIGGIEIQDEVVRAIASAVPGELERSRYDLARSKRVENLTAYDYVLRGRWHQWHATVDQQEVVDPFKKALEIQPNNSRRNAMV